MREQIERRQENDSGVECESEERVEYGKWSECEERVECESGERVECECGESGVFV